MRLAVKFVPPERQNIVQQVLPEHKSTHGKAKMAAREKLSMNACEQVDKERISVKLSVTILRKSVYFGHPAWQLSV